MKLLYMCVIVFLSQAFLTQGQPNGTCWSHAVTHVDGGNIRWWTGDDACSLSEADLEAGLPRNQADCEANRGVIVGTQGRVSVCVPSINGLERCCRDEDAALHLILVVRPRCIFVPNPLDPATGDCISQGMDNPAFNIAVLPSSGPCGPACESRPDDDDDDVPPALPPFNWQTGA